jgi:hypothetical protein
LCEGGSAFKTERIPMRTVMFLVVGLLLVAALLMLGKLFSTNYPEAPRIATIVFVLLWLVIAGVNLWVGVSKAGYSFGEEAPIFLLIFAVPAAVAVLIKWRFM